MENWNSNQFRTCVYNDFCLQTSCNLFADFQSLTDISPSIRTASTTRAARTFIVPTSRLIENWCPWGRSLASFIICHIVLTYLPSAHGLWTPGEENAFTAQPKINSQSQVFRYGRSIFCLPHRPKFSDFFDFCLYWVVFLISKYQKSYLKCVKVGVT